LGWARCNTSEAAMVITHTPTRQASYDVIDHALQTAEGTFRCVRMQDAPATDAVEGSVHWKPAKSLWISTMTLAAVIGGPLFFTWGALALFLATTATTVCLGHSLGMHRRLIA
jgi:hypothetical protein